jgi:hypothetical protein
MRRRVAIKRHSPCAYLIVTWEQHPLASLSYAAIRDNKSARKPFLTLAVSNQAIKRIGRRFRDLCGGGSRPVEPLGQRGRQRGTSLTQTMQLRRDQFHNLGMGKWHDPFNQEAGSFLDKAAGPLLHQAGDPVAAKQLALQSLANLRELQASAFAYFDVLWVLAVVTLFLVFAMLLMKCSVAEKGVRIGAE